MELGRITLGVFAILLGIHYFIFKLKIFEVKLGATKTQPILFKEVQKSYMTKDEEFEMDFNIMRSIVFIVLGAAITYLGLVK